MEFLGYIYHIPCIFPHPFSVLCNSVLSRSMVCEVFYILLSLVTVSFVCYMRKTGKRSISLFPSKEMIRSLYISDQFMALLSVCLQLISVTT
jgi:hypothetical protein